jgi:virulence-associated protein VagC
MKERGLGADRVQILAIGEQRVLIPTVAPVEAVVNNAR